jgi:hypothetical protein
LNFATPQSSAVSTNPLGTKRKTPAIRLRLASAIMV